MTQTLMTTVDYCKHRDISRTQFYYHKRKGALKGCFAKKPGYRKDFVIKELADKALQENVSYIHRMGGMATKHKYKKIEPETPTLNRDDAMTVLHQFVCNEFGLEFMEDERTFTCDELEIHVSDCLDLIFTFLLDIENGTAADPTKAAIAAVYFTLIAMRADSINGANYPFRLEREVLKNRIKK